MLAVEWSNLGYAGSFLGGLLVGVILTSRLTKIVAQYLSEIRRRDRGDDEAT